MNYLYSLLLQCRVFARRRVSRRTWFVHRYDQVSHTKYNLWKLKLVLFPMMGCYFMRPPVWQKEFVFMWYLEALFQKLSKEPDLPLEHLLRFSFQNLIPTIFKSGRVGNFRPIFFIFCISCVRNQPDKFANQGYPKVARSFWSAWSIPPHKFRLQTNPRVSSPLYFL